MKCISILVLAAALAVPAAALACGDTPNAHNLIITPQVRAALAQAYASRTGLTATAVPGRTYYGSHVGIQFALATFGDGRPTIFSDGGMGRWRLLRITHGGICSGVVPLDLIAQWRLAHWRGGCYTEPAL
jgi:hypothetical protein